MIPAFQTSLVRGKIIVRGALDGVVTDLHLAAFILIETGCRPGEIVNLRNEDIVLHDSIPNIAIRPRDGRGAKPKRRSGASYWLVSLLAAQRAPQFALKCIDSHYTSRWKI